MLNDFSDISVDRISGKENAASRLSGGQQAIALLIILLTGLLAFAPNYRNSLATIFLVLFYLFSILYSVGPIRLKERDVVGIICVSLAQRVLPLLIIFAVFEHFGYDTLVFAILSFLIGIRWILIHQLLDRDKDISAGVGTFAANRAPERVFRAMLFCFVMEIVSLIGLMGLLAYEMPFVPIIAILYLIYGLYLTPLWKRVGFRRMLSSYDFAPLADFYYFWLPFSVSILLSCLNPFLLAIPVIEVIWKTAYIKLDIGLIKLRKVYT